MEEEVIMAFEMLHEISKASSLLSAQIQARMNEAAVKTNVPNLTDEERKVAEYLKDRWSASWHVLIDAIETVTDTESSTNSLIITE